MIGYLTLGSNDFERACQFYDALLAEIGAARTMAIDDRLVFWGKSARGPFLAVARPYDGEPASAGNGTMLALPVADQDQVHALHEKALSLGAVDEGAPGLRTNNFYGAYFRDMDGNKLCVFTML